MGTKMKTINPYTRERSTKDIVSGEKKRNTKWYRSKYLKKKKNTQKKIPDLHLKRKQQSMEDTQTEEQ